MKYGVSPKDVGALDALRAIFSTGSPLPVDAYRWVYDAVMRDFWLAAVSGGTDIAGGFVSSAASLPVVAGEIQCRVRVPDCCAMGGHPSRESLGNWNPHARDVFGDRTVDEHCFSVARGVVKNEHSSRIESRDRPQIVHDLATESRKRHALRERRQTCKKAQRFEWGHLCDGGIWHRDWWPRVCIGLVGQDQRWDVAQFCTCTKSCVISDECVYNERVVHLSASLRQNVKSILRRHGGSVGPV